MFHYFFPDHVSTSGFILLGKLVPKLKILVELGPALGHLIGDETEQMVKEIQYHLVVFVEVFIVKCQVFVLNVVSEGICQEISYVRPHLQL